MVDILRWRRRCRPCGRSWHTQHDLHGCLLGVWREYDIAGDRSPPSVRVSAWLCELESLDVAGTGGRGGQNYRFLKLIAIVTLSLS